MFNAHLEASTCSKAGCVVGTEKSPSAEQGISKGMGPGQDGSSVMLGGKAIRPLLSLSHGRVTRDRHGLGPAENYADML